jgi:hypothetical protein
LDGAPLLLKAVMAQVSSSLGSNISDFPSAFIQRKHSARTHTMYNSVKLPKDSRIDNNFKKEKDMGIKKNDPAKKLKQKQNKTTPHKNQQATKCMVEEIVLYNLKFSYFWILIWKEAGVRDRNKTKLY